MDIKAYISSGILETYVLGELTLAEAQEVERMAAQYPEVSNELLAIEATLQELSLAGAKPVPPARRNLLMQEINKDIAPPAASADNENPPLGRLRPIEVNQEPKKYSWLLAASIALAMLSSIAAAVFYTEWQEAEGRIVNLQAETDRYANQIDKLETTSNQLGEQLAVATSPSFKIIQLQGQAPAPKAQAQVYWNAGTSEVFVTPGSLPNPPADKQYQLWALVDGNPVDMGVFEMEADGLQKMNATAQADAFAVTLEPKGGSPTPTLEQMYVMGPTS